MAVAIGFGAMTCRVVGGGGMVRGLAALNFSSTSAFQTRRRTDHRNHLDHLDIASPQGA
jgi:hypothetical protein